MVKGVMRSGRWCCHCRSPALGHLTSCDSNQSQASPFFGRVDVVICLSTTVRNDTLQEAKEHRVSLKCRKQLRVEELEMVMPRAGASRPRNHRGGE